MKADDQLDSAQPDSAQLDRVFAALSHPTRRAILHRLAEGEAGVSELAAPHDMSLPAVSKHIRVLEEAGLVVRSRRAQFRPCTLDPDALDLALTWVEEQRERWHGRLDRLEDHIRRTQEQQ